MQNQQAETEGPSQNNEKVDMQRLEESHKGEVEALVARNKSVLFENFKSILTPQTERLGTFLVERSLLFARTAPLTQEQRMMFIHAGHALLFYLEKFGQMHGDPHASNILQQLVNRRQNTAIRLELRNRLCTHHSEVDDVLTLAPLLQGQSPSEVICQWLGNGASDLVKVSKSSSGSFFIDVTHNKWHGKGDRRFLDATRQDLHAWTELRFSKHSRPFVRKFESDKEEYLKQNTPTDEYNAHVLDTKMALLKMKRDLSCKELASLRKTYRTSVEDESKKRNRNLKAAEALIEIYASKRARR